MKPIFSSFLILLLFSEVLVVDEKKSLPLSLNPALNYEDCTRFKHTRWLLPLQTDLWEATTHPESHWEPLHSLQLAQLQVWGPVGLNELLWNENAPCFDTHAAIVTMFNLLLLQISPNPYFPTSPCEEHSRFLLLHLLRTQNVWAELITDSIC